MSGDMTVLDSLGWHASVAGDLSAAQYQEHRERLVCPACEHWPFPASVELASAQGGEVR